MSLTITAYDGVLRDIVTIQFMRHNEPRQVIIFMNFFNFTTTAANDVHCIILLYMYSIQQFDELRGCARSLFQWGVLWVGWHIARAHSITDYNSLPTLRVSWCSRRCLAIIAPLQDHDKHYSFKNIYIYIHFHHMLGVFAFTPWIGFCASAFCCV